MPKIIFLSGASGAGKTTIVNKLKEDIKQEDIVLLNFDSIGVPSEEEMIREFGSGREWQQKTTYRWVELITTQYKDKKCVIIEGQVDLNFILSAFELYNVTNYKILLIHSNKDDRHERLLKERKQPELINEDMETFANYLFKQAEDYHIPIINTSNISVEEAVEIVRELAYR